MALSGTLRPSTGGGGGGTGIAGAIPARRADAGAAAAARPPDSAAGFQILMTGQIEAGGAWRPQCDRRCRRCRPHPPPPPHSPPTHPNPHTAQFAGADNLFCRYTLSMGADWRVVAGAGQGFSQVAAKGTSGDASVVWTFPLDATSRSPNVHGGPRLVVSVRPAVWRGRGWCNPR